MMNDKTSIGYAVTLTMDYGNGRQVTIAGCLPLNATRKEFDIELDKLRTATNRQQAFITVRSNEAKLAAEQKMAVACRAMADAHEKEMDKVLSELTDSPRANHTTVKAQVENMKQQALQFRQAKLMEAKQHDTNAEICEVIIAGAKLETEEKSED
jgi:hypothetical protein